jgi:endonuclease YncB( thermonuclease family)
VYFVVGLLFAAAAALAPPAHAQERTPAQVVKVVSGDTVDAQLSSGIVLGVRLVGIDAPSPDECGGRESADQLERVLLGRNVSLVRDSAQYGVDGSGRSLFYVDRDDGLDAGLEQLRGGWAEAKPGSFDREQQYFDVDGEASGVGAGVWTLCDGDFNFSRAERERELKRSATAFMRRYYRLVSRHRYATAWGMLSRQVKRGIGSFASWKLGHRRTVGVSVRSATARLSGERAVVSVSLRGRDRDACNGRVVAQTFRGRWLLAPRGGGWVAVRERMRKTGGGRVRVFKSQCPKPKPPPPPPTPTPTPSPSPAPNCQGYDPCIAPGSDVDCAGGSGNGPRYVDGPVVVGGSDPYGLDSDGDGLGCED